MNFFFPIEKSSWKQTGLCLIWNPSSQAFLRVWELLSHVSTSRWTLIPSKVRCCPRFSGRGVMSCWQAHCLLSLLATAESVTASHMLWNSDLLEVCISGQSSYNSPLTLHCQTTLWTTTTEGERKVSNSVWKATFSRGEKIKSYGMKCISTRIYDQADFCQVFFPSPLWH